MNNRLAEECRLSFYKELYHMDHPGYSVVMDETTGKIYVKKELQIYDEKVYDYLEEHHCAYIPAVYEVWKSKDKLMVIEEFIQGDTLRSLLESRVLSEAGKKAIISQICDALIFLHEADPPIIHRDIKAENIMVTEEGKAYLIDYNAARLYRKNQSRDTILLGTEGAAAPEQYGFRQSDARTDIYGLGILIREIFPDNRHMQKVAEKATRMDPDQRYQNVREMKNAFEWRENRYGFGTGAEHRKQDTKIKANIPGFRTGKVWKMIVAVTAYLLILYCGLTLQVKNAKSAADLWLNRITFLLIGENLIDLYTNWTPLFRNFPFMRSKKTAGKIIGYIVNTVIIVVFWLVLLVMIEHFL